MKLYYDPNNDKIVEADFLEMQLFTRDVHGNISTHKNLDHLVLLGDIYDKPIRLGQQELSLYKMIEGEKNFIIHGTSREGKLEQGLRFNVNGRGFNYYSTNLIVGVESVDATTIDFYTLSGSHYRLELV